MSVAPITIEAQHLKSGRVAFSSEPKKDCSTWGLSSVFVPTTFNVVESHEFNCGFSTATTTDFTVAVVGKNFKPYFLTIWFPFFSRIICSAFFAHRPDTDFEAVTGGEELSGRWFGLAATSAFVYFWSWQIIWPAITRIAFSGTVNCNYFSCFICSCIARQLPKCGATFLANPWYFDAGFWFTVSDNMLNRAAMGAVFLLWVGRDCERFTAFEAIADGLFATKI